jgi:hypothetical protein
MIALTVIVTAWLLVPILGEIVQRFTTKPLAKVSMKVDGFWDYVGGGEGTRHILMVDTDEIARMNADHPVSSAMEPPRGNWKDGTP